MANANQNYKVPETFWYNRLLGECRACPRREFVQCSEPCGLTKPKMTSCAGNNSIGIEVIKSEALHEAVRRRDFVRLKGLLKSGADANSRDCKSRTALHVAALNANLSCASILLDYGADPNTKCDAGYSALLYAARSKCLHMMQLIIDRGANVNARGNDGNSYIHGVMDLDPKVCQILIHNGADVNAYNSASYTPLHLACKEGRQDLVDLLLRHGARIDDTGPGRSNETPLSSAMQSQINNEIILSLLSRGADVNRRISNGSTVLHEAVKHCGSETVREFLKHGASVHATTSEGQTPLHCVLRVPEQVDLEILMCLLECGADVHARDHLGQTPLHYVTKTERDSSRVIQELLDNGAAIDVRDKIGWTPLHNATRFRSIRNVEALLRNGASVTTELDILKSKFSVNDEVVRTFASFYVAKFVIGSFEADVDQTTLESTFGANNVMLHLDECKKEVELMKNLVLCGNVTVLQFLRASQRRIFVLLTNYKKDEILSDSVLSQFPRYRYILEKNLKIFEQRKLIGDAMETLDAMCQSVLPISVLENVIDLLTFGDMVNLVKAGYLVL